MAKLLLTRPNYDDTTDALSKWAELIIEIAKEKQIIVLDLFADKATQKVFFSYLKKNPNIIFLNGHGNDQVITGQNNEMLLSISTDNSELKGSIIYARSCEAGRLLGPSLIAQGVRTLIGYKKKFFFFRSNDHSTRPIDDPYAKVFLEPSNLVVSTLLKGNSAEIAQNRSKELMWKNFQQLLTSSQSHESRLMAPYLWSNMTSQVLLGDKEARI